MILVRHGQSLFNVHHDRTGEDPGIPDPSLTEKGKRQAEEAAKRLKDHRHPIRRLLVSPYTRTLETAEIIAETLGLAIEIEPLIREHAFYQCDIGSPRSHLAKRWPKFDFNHLPETWWPNLDETKAELARRCDTFRARAAAFIDWPHVAIVSHWGFILQLTGHSARNAELVPFDPTGTK